MSPKLFTFIALLLAVAGGVALKQIAAPAWTLGVFVIVICSMVYYIFDLPDELD
jgi:hypothetical protein